MLTKKSISELEQILPKMKSDFKSQLDKRYKYEQIDKYLQKTGDYNEETLRGEHVTQHAI